MQSFRLSYLRYRFPGRIQGNVANPLMWDLIFSISIFSRISSGEEIPLAASFKEIHIDRVSSPTEELDGPGIQLSWKGSGTLQSSEDPSGPWKNVIEANNPYQSSAVDQYRFYRVQTLNPARLLVEEIVKETIENVRFVGRSSHGEAFVHLGFSYSLPGIQENWNGSASLFDPECNEAFFYDKFCESAGNPAEEGSSGGSLLSGFDKCMRLGCESERVHLVEMEYAGRTQSSPETSNLLTYESLIPSGQIAFEANPRILWHIDRNDPFAWVIWSEIEAHITFNSSEDSQYDLSHLGQVTLVRDGDDLATIDLELNFTGVHKDAIPLSVLVSVNSDGDSEGSVLFEDRLIALIHGHDELLFDWEE